MPCYQEVNLYIQADNTYANLDQAKLEQLMQVYWFCEMPIRNQNNLFHPNGEQCSRKSNEKRSSTDSYDNHEKLYNGYKYSTRTRYDERGSKQTIYCCRFEDCTKEFTRTNNILDHLRMHAGIKPFNWSHCLKSFTQKCNLNKHLKTHLVPEMKNRKRYKCNYCDACYTERYNYKVSTLLQSFIQICC
jgi:hypothetical protein